MFYDLIQHLTLVAVKHAAVQIITTYVCKTRKNISPLLNGVGFISWLSFISPLPLEIVQGLTMPKARRLDVVKYRKNGRPRFPHEEELLQTPL
jgi:hypothetical protein